MSNRSTRRTALNRARQASLRTGQFGLALKHGAYSGMSLLPGECSAQFRKLHKEVIADLNLSGRIELDIGDTITRLLWRKQSLGTYGLAEFARQRYFALKSEQDESQRNRVTEAKKKYQLMRKHHEFEREKEQRGETLTEEEIQRMREELQDPEIKEEERFDQLWVELHSSPRYQKLIEEQKLKEEHIRREMGTVAFELAQIPHAATTGYLLHELTIIDRIEGMIDRCLKRLLLVRGLKSISSSLPAAPKQITAPEAKPGAKEPRK